MKTIVTTLSISLVRMEVEGVDVLARISRLNSRRRVVAGTLNNLWRKYAKEPTEQLYAEIEMHQEVLKDYEDELNYLINGIED